MKMKVIVNPVAGRGRSLGRWKRAEAQLMKLGVPYVPYLTNGAGHARALAASARAEGYQIVMSVGGDGTLNEVVNGCMGSDISIAVVSTGTGNDFVKSAGLPSDPAQAVRLCMEGVPQPVDVGEFNGRFFINASGIGFDAEVADMVNKRYRHLRGSCPYILGVLNRLPSFKLPHFHMQLDQIEADFTAWMVAVVSGSFYGGGMHVVPGADISDGLLDIAVIGSLGRFELLRLFPKVFSGEHIHHPKVSLYRTSRVKLESDRPVRIQADGEVFEGQNFDFRIHPGAIRVFMPPMLPKTGNRRALPNKPADEGESFK